MHSDDLILFLWFVTRYHTDNGKVIKAVRTDTQPIVIEEIQVFPLTVPVTNLLIHRGRGDDEARILVSSQSEIVAMKLQRCYSDKVSTCGECVKLRDPYCAWDKRKQKCVAVGSWTLGSNLFQSVATGVHESCPESSKASATHKSPPSRDNSAATGGSYVSAEASLFNADVAGSSLGRGGKSFPSAVPGQSLDSDKDLDIDPESELDPNLIDLDDDGVGVGVEGNGLGVGDGPRIAPDESQPKYTVETLAIAVAAGSLAALFLGFVLGYCCGRKCRKSEDENMPYPDTEYEYFEQRQNCHMRR